MFTWRLILIIVLLVAGFYLYFAYPDLKDLTHAQKDHYRRMRYLGIALIAGAIGYAIYAYYTGGLRFKANMLSPQCEACNDYLKNVPLGGYQDVRYLPILERYKEACKQCSDQCIEQLERVMAIPGVKPRDVQREMTACQKQVNAARRIDTNISALRTKQREPAAAIAARAIRAGADVFPPIPRE